MITPSVYQLEFIAHQVDGFGQVRPVKEAWLEEIELSMVVPPLQTTFSTFELAEACINGMATASRLATEQDEALVARFIEGILVWTLSRNGYRFLGSEGALSDALTKILANPDRFLASGTAQKASNWLVEHVQAIETSDAMALYSRGRNYRAYMCSALTGLTDEENASVLAISDAINSYLEDRGIWTHLPARYTNPKSDKNVSKEEVHHFDHSLVIHSDLVIALLDWPTTGGGKELCWAERAGVPVLVVSASRPRISKLVLGATGDLIVGPLSNFGVLVDSIMPAVIERNHRRLRNVRTFGPLISQVRDSATGIGSRRLTELRQSPEHLANAAFWEVMEALPPAHYGDPRPLDAQQIEALVAYSRERLTPTDTVLLAQKAMFLPTDAGVKNRRTFRNPKDWADLNRQ